MWQFGDRWFDWLRKLLRRGHYAVIMLEAIRVLFGSVQQRHAYPMNLGGKLQGQVFQDQVYQERTQLHKIYNPELNEYI